MPVPAISGHRYDEQAFLVSLDKKTGKHGERDNARAHCRNRPIGTEHRAGSNQLIPKR